MLRWRQINWRALNKFPMLLSYEWIKMFTTEMMVSPYICSCLPYFWFECISFDARIYNTNHLFNKKNLERSLIHPSKIMQNHHWMAAHKIVRTRYFVPHTLASHTNLIKYETMILPASSKTNGFDIIALAYTYNHTYMYTPDTYPTPAYPAYSVNCEYAWSAALRQYI